MTIQYMGISTVDIITKINFSETVIQIHRSNIWSSVINYMKNVLYIILAEGKKPPTTAKT